MGGVLFLAPFCGMLYLFGLPAEGIGSWPCYLTIFLGVAFGTICISLFMVGIMWSCTRPWAALLLLVVAIMGNLLIATFNPLLIMLWMGSSSSLLYWYFEWYPDWCKDSNAPRPGEASTPVCKIVLNLVQILHLPPASDVESSLFFFSLLLRADWCQGIGPVELEWDITAWGVSLPPPSRLRNRQWAHHHPPLPIPVGLPCLSFKLA